MPCKCSQCTDTPAETYTEKHRHRCEAKAVAKMFWRDVDGFEKFMVGVTEKRGAPAAYKLRKAVEWLWDLLKNDSNSKKSA